MFMNHLSSGARPGDLIASPPGLRARHVLAHEAALEVVETVTTTAHRWLTQHRTCQRPRYDARAELAVVPLASVFAPDLNFGLQLKVLAAFSVFYFTAKAFVR